LRRGLLVPWSVTEPETNRAQHQDSRHSSIIGVRSSVGFHDVAQGEVGAGVDGVGVVEGVAEFGDGGGMPWRRKRVEPALDLRCANNTERVSWFWSL
jgi:hypothetical protein